MEPQFKFTEIGHDELRAIEGGLSWSGIWDAISGEAIWVGDHISVGFKDMGGALAGIIRYGFRF